MKIFSVEQIRAWDAFTIEHEPISSLDLMYRASVAFVDAFVQLYPDTERPVYIVCGTGNNGGDGLVVARILHQKFYTVKVRTCGFSGHKSQDFEAQLNLLPADIECLDWTNIQPEPTAIIIDALFGSGLNRPLDGLYSNIVKIINNWNLPVVALDIPSGLFANKKTEGACITATHTITFQVPKLAFFSSEIVGTWQVVDIGLHPEYNRRTSTPFFFMKNTEFFKTEDSFSGIIKRFKHRPKHAHKGTFGHAALVGGSKGMMGAMVLSTNACLRSGVGLTTCYTSDNERFILQISTPEALCMPLQGGIEWNKYNALGIGPGWSTSPEQMLFLNLILNEKKLPPLVLDADALNILAKNKEWLKQIPAQSILTPHPKEFERLFGKTKDNFERLDILRKKAQQYKLYIVLKGAHTAIATPEGSVYFNNTGNPGMAKGGSGDVLTGLIVGLLAQGFLPKEAACLGVFLHGWAGDRAAEILGQRAMTAGDLARYFGKLEL